ncbi:hypothetical protein HHK36_024572 [Tetracentron sinense]|uniref:RING-type E3 ubiquitin transferase n=1 Tax=Tetracentron sinense TaxID=13715 RepID=A0A834YQX6_TETSI|nr:hypothetical protein HHK36_024572 [Tetracentron sinense]
MAGGGVSQFGQALLDILHDISRISKFGDAFKRDCTALVRRTSLLSHLFEEIRDFKGDCPTCASTSSSSSSSSSSCCFTDLLVSLQAAKRLLLVAGNSDSMIFPCASPQNLLSPLNLALSQFKDEAGEKIDFQFQCVTWQLETALGNLPYDHFDISDEVREQVELVQAQLRRATERNGPLNPKILSCALSHSLDIEAHMLESDFGNLQLMNISKTAHEFKAMVDIVPKVNGKKGSNMEQMIPKLKRLRNFSASSEVCQPNEVEADKVDNLANKSLEEIKNPNSVVIPDDFLCPISLEPMRDPVIVATGQTYERSYIQRWIDCGNKTCPKTQQKLQNLTLTPNYVLRSLITQWCEEHNIEQPMGSAKGRIRKSDGSFKDVSEDRAAIEALVRKLSSRSVEERRTAATEIRSLSKRSTDNRIMIAEAGAIPSLVNLLTIEDMTTQENAVTSILNLSIYDYNKELIMLAGAVPSIVQVLRVGSMEARENAAATLFSLSLLDENKIIIGASGAIHDLVELLRNGSTRGKKDAATALFNLCTYQGNKGRAVRAGILLPLMKMLTETSRCMVDEALTILSVLASHHEGKVAIKKASVIPVLIDLMRTGLPRNKENTAAILLSLCKKDDENLACIGRLGAVIPLTELAKSGTERAKRKATSLLEHLQKLKQL